MVSAAAQIISVLVPFFVVIVTLTLGLYFLFNPKKRPHCRCSNKVESESNSDITQEAIKLADEQQKTERNDGDTDDITAPPAELRRKKSVTFNITRSSIILTPPPTDKIEKVGVFGGSGVDSASSFGSSSYTDSSSTSVSSDTGSSAGSSVNLLPMGKEDQVRKSIPNATETTPVQVLWSQSGLEESTPLEPDTKVKKTTVTPVTSPLFSSSSSFSELSFMSSSYSSPDIVADSDSETSTCTDSSSDSSCSPTSTDSASSSVTSVKAATNVDFPCADHKGHTKETFIQVDQNPDVNKPSSSSEQNLKSVHVPIESGISGHAELGDPSGIAGLVSIRIEGPSTSPHTFSPVEPSLPSLHKFTVEPVENSAIDVSSGNGEKTLSVNSEAETVGNADLFCVVEETEKESSAPTSGEREQISVVEKSFTGIKVDVSSLPESEPGVSDPLITEGGESHFETEEDTINGVTTGNDFTFGEEDTISAIIELYEKTLDLTIGETTVHVDERNSSSGSADLSLPEINEGNDCQESPPHDLEQEVLPNLNTEREEPEATDTFDQSSSLVKSADESSELPQVSSPNKDKEEETDMATAHFQAGMYENVAKLGRLNTNGEKSQDSKPFVMPPLRLHGVVIPDVSQKEPDLTPEKTSEPGKTSEPDSKVEQPVKAPTPPALPKFRQLSINSPEKRPPPIDVDSKPTDNSMNVKMRTITVPVLPSSVEHSVPVRSAVSKEQPDSDADGSYVEPSTVVSERPLLKRPTTTPVKLMNTSDGAVSTMPNYSIEERAAVEQLRNKLRQRDRLKLVQKMMEEDKMKSRRSWEKKLLSGGEEDKKSDISPQPPPQETKHNCRHHHHHRRRRSKGDKNHRRDSKSSQESSVLSEKEMMLKRLGRNMRARDRRLNTPLNPTEKEASARSQDLLQLLTQSQKISADKPVILFTRTRGVNEDNDDANTIVSDSAQPMAMSTVNKINSNSRKHHRGRGRHRMPTLKTPFDKPIPEGSNGNNHMDSHRSEISVMSDSAVDRLISEGTLVRTKADLTLPPNVQRNIVCPSF